VRGKKFTVLDTEAVMQHLLASKRGYSSIQSLIEEAIRLGLIEPVRVDTTRPGTIEEDS
jgi:hypothetical protein